MTHAHLYPDEASQLLIRVPTATVGSVSMSGVGCNVGSFLAGSWNQHFQGLITKEFWSGLAQPVTDNVSNRYLKWACWNFYKPTWTWNKPQDRIGGEVSGHHLLFSFLRVLSSRGPDPVTSLKNVCTGLITCTTTYYHHKDDHLCKVSHNFSTRLIWSTRLFKWLYDTSSLAPKACYMSIVHIGYCTTGWQSTTTVWTKLHMIICVLLNWDFCSHWDW